MAWFTVSLLATVGLWRLLLARQEKPPEVPQLGLVLLVVPVVVVRFSRGEAVSSDDRAGAVATGRLAGSYGYCLILLAMSVLMVAACLLSGEVTVARRHRGGGRRR
ncbi:hypothetical protein IU494_03510 [Nocardia terpenica]|uniref:hypothetical protein n=1 Tax=Nocardia terpenica TaxID=455432 RepID=UPI0018941462|nr:hypothetical protein [Nocardia terpenica]MBF6059849.1 hypothetical protein [Nocardia terpenica]MBF6111199.1 hypothetical protein [Nocardia terpenica]MBF6117330.1 hypothetical protein [Nocardia terpenica]